MVGLRWSRGWVSVLVALTLLTGCGGGGGGTGAATPVAAPVAPTALTYSSPKTAIVGTAFTLTPTVTGTPTSYAVSPALPAGLVLDTATGGISGTPTTTSPATAYTITASNAAGSTSAILSLRVDPAPPSGLVYPGPVVATVGTSIANVAPVVVGTVSGFAVAPALPAGLGLDPATGVISGTPTAALAQTTFTITASNAGGSTSAQWILTVNPAAPSGLSYPSPLLATVGTPIATLAPTVNGVVTIYTVQPALPGGLTLNPAAGTIAGTPTAVTPQATYTITATNASGSSSFGLSIVVRAPNANPNAAADTAETISGGSVTLDVLANDSDPDGQALAVTGTSSPSSGTATVNPDGTVRYSAPTSFSGVATFTYTVSDAVGGTATGTARVTVWPCNWSRATADRPDDFGGAQLKYAYVIPADGSDEQLDLNGTVCRTVWSTDRWFATRSEGRHVHVDTVDGAPDVLMMKLTLTDAQVRDAERNGTSILTTLTQQMTGQNVLSAGKNFVVVYGGSAGTCGESSTKSRVAALYPKAVDASGRSCAPRPLGASLSAPGELDLRALRLALNSFGFVPSCAPHQSGGFVTDDPNDLMYAGPQPWTPSALDANRDDYFGHGRANCADLASVSFVLRPRVNVVYLVPANRTESPGAATRMADALRNLQAFFDREVALGRRFVLADPVVRVLQSPQIDTWFRDNVPGSGSTIYDWNGNVHGEVRRLLGTSPYYGDSNNIWLTYADSLPACNQIAGGGGGVALLHRSDLQALMQASFIEDPCGPNTLTWTYTREVGGLGHEFGHAMGLPHPPGCDAPAAGVVCDANALMWTGYGIYPNTYLTAENKAALRRTPWFIYGERSP